MDLERIKQKIRLRSGRLKKKRPPAARPAHDRESDGATKNAPLPSNPSTETTKRATTDHYSQTEQDQTAQTPTANGTYASHAEERRQDHQVHTYTPPSHKRRNLDRASRNDIARHPAMEEPSAYQPDEADSADFDLRPPAPRVRSPSVETIAELLFSSGHLNAILHDQRSISRFTAFLTRYRPKYQALILQYLETQKAIRAVEYANAVAEGVSATDGSGTDDGQRSTPRPAAQLDKAFEEASTSAFRALVGEALPGYITYNLMKLASECLINEVTGKQSVLMQSLVGGLSEVFCITDPNQKDNPIIYASEEFYRYTGYGSDDVIGNNCRFLQGPKTSRDSIRRLKEATERGEAICETLLNYRRDGHPFINLLMIAPLYDDKGRVKYQIGAQVDVSGLVEKGRGLDSFARYLTLRNNDRGRRATSEGTVHKQHALTKLRELSEMFDLEESAVVETHSRANSSTRTDDSRSIGSGERPKTLRRLFVSDSGSESGDEDNHATDAPKDTWALAQQGPRGTSTGKLPGIYDTYMLIRPAPSSRIVFVSAKLQKLVKAVQSPFLSHVAAPPRTLAGLKESFMAGVPVGARINFMAQPGEVRDGMKIPTGDKHEDNKYGRACWISATPLLGSDERPGVWMIVFVEKSKAPKAGRVRSAEVEARAEAESRNDVQKTDISNLPSTRGEMPSTTPPRPRPDLRERRQLSKNELHIKARRLDEAEPPPEKPLGENDDSATEVEDYHEAQVEVHEDRPERHSAETLTEQPSAESHAEVISTKTVSSTHTPNIESTNRIVIPPSPDHEEVRQQEFEEQHKQSEPLNDAPPIKSRERSDTGYESTPKFRLDLEELRKFTPPPQIDSSMLVKTPRRDDDEQAAANGQHQESDSDRIDDTPVATRPHTRRSSGGKGEAESPQVQSPLEETQAAHEDEDRRIDEEEHPLEIEDRPPLKRDPNGPSGLMMDYLTQPGSGRRRVNAEEFGRVLQERGGRQSEDWSDTECLRTPYSVD